MDVLASTLVQINISMLVVMYKVSISYCLIRYIHRTIEVIVTLDLGTSSAKALSFSFSADNGFWE